MNCLRKLDEQILTRISIILLVRVLSASHDVSLLVVFDFETYHVFGNNKNNHDAEWRAFQ